MTPHELNEELFRRRDALHQGGGDEAAARQHAKGKLTARERIDRLLDAGSFQEVDPYTTHRHTAFGLDEKRIPGDSVVVGLGRIDGRKVAIAAQDFTIIGGSFSEIQAQKVCKVLDLAVGSGVPFVCLNDSVGARIQEGVWSLAGYSELFWRNTQASGVIPQISIMLGPCAGGSVYSPGLTDFIIMTEGISHMFITGPEVIKAVTGEDVTQEDLGGAMAHNSKSGVAHFAAEDEDDLFSQVRTLLSFLPANNMEDPPYAPPADDPDREAPQLDTLVPDSSQKPYDIKEAVRAIVDDNVFFEVQQYWAQNIVVGFARLGGRPVGIIANQPAYLAGVLDCNASNKGARFIRFCDAFNVPLVTFVDVPGYMPGTDQEWGGIIRNGAKLIFAYSEATVPKLTVITRKAYGGAYCVMASKHIRTDFNFAWPTAEIAVMGPQGAVQIVYRRELQAAGDMAAELRQRKVDEYRAKFANPWIAAERGYVDEVIEPARTRSKLIAALRLLETKRETNPPRKHGNIPL